MALHLVPRGLRYVEAVAEHGSIQAASRAVGISASAIDRQVVLLEERLGVQLFDRLSTGMSLSPAGELMVVLARRWQEDQNRIWSDVKQMQGVDLGHIRLATMDSLANGPIPDFLCRLAEDYPRVRIDVEIATPDDAHEALSAGAADIALAFNLRPDRDTHVVWTEDLPLVCIVAPDHPLASWDAVSIKQARAYPLVVQSRALSIRRMLEARHSSMFAESQPPVVTNSLQLLKSVVISGSHVALTSRLDAAAELRSGRLRALPVTDRTAAHQTISAAISARRALPKICRTICDALVAEMADTVAELQP